MSCFAVFALWASSDLTGQRGFQFGPGTAPRMFAIMLGAMGVIIMLIGLTTDGPTLQRYAIRGPVLVTASILFFAVAIRPLGLVFTSFLTVLIAAVRLRRGALDRDRDLVGVSVAVLFVVVSQGAQPAAAIVAGMVDAGAWNVSESFQVMMDLINNLALGFGVVNQIVWYNLGAFSIPVPINIVLCLIGALVGTLVGVLPGVGPLATIAMLLPITFGLQPVGALIMLAGIYYGAQYGGSTTSILVNIPGEASSVVTTLDGHQMAKQGRAGPALAIAAIGSFFAGSVATILVAALGVPLTGLALKFGPAEYFSLMVLGLVFAVVLAKGSVPKAITMILFGLLLSMVGSDLETGASRMAFNIPELADGIGFVTVAMGVFGIAEIIRNLEGSHDRDHRQCQDHRPDADDERLEGLRRPDRARHRAGLDPRHPARRRRRDRGVRGLHV